MFKSWAWALKFNLIFFRNACRILDYEWSFFQIMKYELDAFIYFSLEKTLFDFRGIHFCNQKNSAGELNWIALQIYILHFIHNPHACPQIHSWSKCVQKDVKVGQLFSIVCSLSYYTYNTCIMQSLKVNLLSEMKYFCSRIIRSIPHLGSFWLFR